MTRTRWRWVRNVTVLGATAGLLVSTTGCFGRFRAMNTVYDFNKSATDNGVVRSLLMVGMLIVPVYEVSFLIDALVLNTLDFFNGTKNVSTTETLPDGTKLTMSKVDGDTVRVRHVDAEGRERSFDVVRVGERAGYVRAADGRVVRGVERLPDGRLQPSAP
jgi:hypothetical protein